MKKIKEIIYLAGVVFNPISRSKLKKFINSKMPNIYCHHMTVKYGGIKEIHDSLGMKIKFNTEKIFFNEKAIAISGNIDEPIIKNIMEESNQHAHITICTAAGVAPVYSNDLLKEGNSLEYQDSIFLKFGAFVVFEDDSTGWVFESEK